MPTKTTTATTERLFSPEAVAAYLGTKTDWVLKAIREGRLQCHRLSPKVIRIDAVQVRDFMAATGTEAPKVGKRPGSAFSADACQPPKFPHRKPATTPDPAKIDWKV